MWNSSATGWRCHSRIECGFVSATPLQLPVPCQCADGPSIGNEEGGGRGEEEEEDYLLVFNAAVRGLRSSLHTNTLFAKSLMHALCMDEGERERGVGRGGDRD